MSKKNQPQAPLNPNNVTRDAVKAVAKSVTQSSSPSERKTVERVNVLIRLKKAGPSSFQTRINGQKFTFDKKVTAYSVPEELFNRINIHNIFDYIGPDRGIVDAMQVEEELGIQLQSSADSNTAELLERLKEAEERAENAETKAERLEKEMDDLLSSETGKEPEPVTPPAEPHE